MNKKLIYVAGCSGFIGSCLVKYFQELGFEVHGSDLVYNNLVAPDRFYDANALLIDPSRIFKNHFLACINAAGSASVPDSFNDPFRDFDLNSILVFKMLDSIRIFSPETKFIHLSSAAVYGNPNNLPIIEESDLEPISPYGTHKLISENIVTEFRNHFGISAASLRIFSAFGPGLRKQIFWDLNSKRLSKDPILLFGTGKETRDFIFIDDVARAIEIVVNSDLNYSVYNVANGVQISIQQVASLFYSLFDTKIDFGFDGISRIGDPLFWQADISRLSSLGYSQSVSLEDGIRKYVEWVR